MSKTKMRCTTCGKWFQSANAKEVTCPDCTQKARKEKMAAKNAPSVSNKPGGTTDAAHRPTVPPPPKPKPVQSGTAHWLDTLQDVKIAEPDEPPLARPKPQAPAARDNRSGPSDPQTPPGPDGYREERERTPGGGRGPGAYREDRDRGPGGYRVGGGSGLPSTTYGPPRPRQPMEGGLARGPRPDTRGPRPDRPGPAGPREGGGPGGFQKPRGKGKPAARKPATPPKPKREKIPPPQPFVPTLEQITQVEERYLELATPIEFDGIRTRIAQELGIPKKAVKKIVRELRSRQDIPSWWELQTYKGSSEELERIKTAYLPLLDTLPPIGVHKQIAEQLDLKAGVVYQAIKAIRLEMNLPQYNDPALHGPDFVARMKRKTPEAQSETPPQESVATQADASPQDSETPEKATATLNTGPATEGDTSLATKAENDADPVTKTEHNTDPVTATDNDLSLTTKAENDADPVTKAENDAIPVTEGITSSEA